MKKVLPSTAEPKPRKRKFTGAVVDLSTVADEFFGGSRRTVENMVLREMIPSRKLGDRRVFLRDDLTEFFRSLPGTSVSEALENCESRAK